MLVVGERKLYFYFWSIEMDPKKLVDANSHLPNEIWMENQIIIMPEVVGITFLR